MLLISAIAKRKILQFKFSAAVKIVLFASELLISRHKIHYRLYRIPTSIIISRLIVSFLWIAVSALYTAEIASVFVMREDLIKTTSDLIKYGYQINTYSSIHVYRLFQVNDFIIRLHNSFCFSKF